jgi:hypothetical protein
MSNKKEDILDKLEDLEGELSEEEKLEIQKKSLRDLKELHSGEIEKWHKRNDETFKEYEMFRAFLKPKAPTESRNMLDIINDELEAHDYDPVDMNVVQETKERLFWDARRAAYNELIDEKRRKYEQLVRAHTSETLLQYSDALLKTAISKGLDGDSRILQYLLDRVMPEKQDAANNIGTVIRLEIPGLETSTVVQEDSETIDMLREKFNIEKETE